MYNNTMTKETFNNLKISEKVELKDHIDRRHFPKGKYTITGKEGTKTITMIHEKTGKRVAMSENSASKLVLLPPEQEKPKTEYNVMELIDYDTKATKDIIQKEIDNGWILEHVTSTIQEGDHDYTKLFFKK